MCTVQQSKNRKKTTTTIQKRETAKQCSRFVRLSPEDMSLHALQLYYSPLERLS